MYKLKEMILMLCFIFSGALCYASSEARMEKEKGEGITIDVKEKASYGGLDKSSTITPTINGHVLTVVFSENLGQVSIEITTSMGDYVQADSCLTPNGIQFYIPLAGDYIVTFTLPNGDEYYGEFTVTN